VVLGDTPEERIETEVIDPTNPESADDHHLEGEDGSPG